MLDSAALPRSARAVVIGGGAAGASIAYHLGKLGWRDVVLVERHGIGDGTTWHSAGFVGQMRASVGQTRMIMASLELYDELERETGLDPGFRAVGGIRLACTEERLQQLRRAQSTALTFGLELEMLSGAEVGERLPMLNVEDVRGAAWLPGDGYLDPEPLVTALIAGAQRHGVAVHTDTAVTGIETAGGRVRSVVTNRGAIATETVINAAGAAAGAVARLAEVIVPVVPIRHQYVVTAPLDPPVGAIPTVRDPDHVTYLRPAGGGLLIGGYGRSPATCDVADPLLEPRVVLEPDPERFSEAWAGARARVPGLAGIEVVQAVNGPEAFTPDGEFILGETAVAGFWVAAGFCVHGLAGAGGVGRTLAEWIVDGQPEIDTLAMDVRRFGAHFGSRSHARTRALDAYSGYYDIVYPYTHRSAGRPLRRTPGYGALAALGARFGEEAGWEHPDWLEVNAPAGDEALRPLGWAGRNWSPAVVTEALAARDAAVLVDRTPLAKLIVHGAGAAEALAKLCAADVDRDVGRIAHTLLLNHGGGIEADVTVTRHSEDRFRLSTGADLGVRTLSWIARHLPHSGSVAVDDVTSLESCLGLWGPAAREILQPLTDADLGDAAFPLFTAQRIWVGAVPVWAQRISSCGELGWELYCTPEYGAALWETIWDVGQPHGLRACGRRAFESMRLEKGHREWGVDLGPRTMPDEVGLGDTVTIDKPGGFLGHAALVAIREAGPPARRLCCLDVADGVRTVALGNEPVRRHGVLVGSVTSGGAGYRSGRSIAYAMLPAELEPGDEVELGLFGAWVGATVTSAPVYDPLGTRAYGDAS